LLRYLGGLGLAGGRGGFLALAGLLALIGGYEQGGLTPSVSYSSMLGANAEALYKTATMGS
jgi:hypothetical protein